MAIEIQWNDTDPATGRKRFVHAEKFARQWSFKVRFHRRENWTRPETISLEMWQTLLDALERRFQRPEGITEEDLQWVRKQIALHEAAPTMLDATALGEQVPPVDAGESSSKTQT